MCLYFGHNLVNFIEFTNDLFEIIFIILYFFLKCRLSISVCRDFYFRQKQQCVPETF